MDPDQLHHFSFIELEASEISSSQQALALNAPFLNTPAAATASGSAAPSAAAGNSQSPLSSSIEPVDEAILILSLTEDENEEEIEKIPVKESEKKKSPMKELEPSVTKKSGEKRRSRGVKLRSSDSEEETAPLTTRRLPATLQATRMMDMDKDFAVKIPTTQKPRKDKEKEIRGKTQSCSDITPEVIKNSIIEEKSDASGSTRISKANPLLDFNNVMDVLTTICGPPDMSLENVDILEIAAMRGIHFNPPRWHRPGGYERKPKI